MYRRIHVLLVCCLLFDPGSLVGESQENERRYLYVKDIDTTLTGEKASVFCDPLDEIVFFLQDKTGKKWWRANDRFTMLLGGQGITLPESGKIGMFPAGIKKSKFKNSDPVDPNWYKITITDGVLIQGNAEAGLTDAAEHLIELFEGAGDGLRLPVGVYTSKERAKDRPAFFSRDLEGGKRLDALYRSPERDSRSENDILQAVREGLPTCQTPKEQILEWIGRKYIGYNPQSRKALNLMIEATKLPDEAIARAAIRYGLARASWKTLRMHRAMCDAALRAGDVDKTVREIAFGLRHSPGDQRDFIETLEPYQKSSDKTVQAKAKQVRTLFQKAISALPKESP